MKPFSLYIHIPYCIHKCPYCDFNTYAVTKIPEKAYVEALLAELDFYGSREEWAGRRLRTIYFGGGTPSLFRPESIQRIVRHAGRLFHLDDHPEISLEANPGSVTLDLLEGYRSAGVNRISLGAQSFQLLVLKTLGRVHSPDDTVHAVSAIKAAGIENFNLDLIYGVPKQTVKQLKNDLRKIIELAPAHVSVYGLTIEKGTPFFTAFKRGDLKLLKEDTLLKMAELVHGDLSSSGYRRYEISNYSIAGSEARHNLAYWQGHDYLGLGAGAHSHVRQGTNAPYGSRWANFASPQQYITHARSLGKAAAWSEDLSLSSAIFEFFFLGLRTKWGVERSRFAERFGIEIEQLFPGMLEVLKEGGLVEFSNTAVTLTERGYLLADTVIEHFQPDERTLKKLLVQEAV